MRLDPAALPRGVVIPVEIEGAEYVIWRGRGGALGSAPRTCPHLDHDLAEGFVVGDELVCPGHSWAFDGRGHAYKRNEQGRVDPKGTVATLRLEEQPDGIDVYGQALMPTTYPPERHLLRDLRLTFEHDGSQLALEPRDRSSRVRMPVVPELGAADGSVRAGALATLVDVIGGGLAASVAHPDWIATADLTLHIVGAVTSGSVEARARVAHAGRTTIVIEVELYDDAAAQIGIATMSFAVLPRRDDNLDVTASTNASGPSTMALPGSRLRSSLLDELEVRVIDAQLGELEAPIDDWSRNSFGAMQGGAVATIVDAAAEAAANAAAAEPLVVTDIQLTYLALARVGPLRTRAVVLGAAPGAVTTRVELVDAGVGSRVTTVARVVATSSLRERP